jgi:hypothetical protein
MGSVNRSEARLGQSLAFSRRGGWAAAMRNANTTDGSVPSREDDDASVGELPAPRWLVAAMAYGVVTAAVSMGVATAVAWVAAEAGGGVLRVTILFLGALGVVAASAAAAGGPLLMRLEDWVRQAAGSGGPERPRRRRR